MEGGKGPELAVQVQWMSQHTRFLQNVFFWCGYIVKVKNAVILIAFDLTL